MTPQTIEAIRAHAVRGGPREACGLLVVVRGREQYIACRNLAGNAGHFILSSEDYAEAENRGEIIAVVHSHPNGPATPSEADRTACEASGLIWHIVPVSCASGQPEAGEIVTLAPCGYEAPLVGREFPHGVNDCYQLVRDWYRRERGIELKNFMRIDGWWERGENLLPEALCRGRFLSRGRRTRRGRHDRHADPVDTTQPCCRLSGRRADSAPSLRQALQPGCIWRVLERRDPDDHAASGHALQGGQQGATGKTA